MDPKLNPRTGPGPKPGVTPKVIGAGFSRTGTKTFAEAMTILYQLPVHDAGVQSMIGTSHVQQNWMQVMELAPRAKTVAEKQKLKYLLADNIDGYVATTDTPVCHFTKELAELYPDAVVIVSTRDKESWHRSFVFMDTLMNNVPLHILVWPVPKLGILGSWSKLLGNVHRWRFGTTELQPEHLEAHEQQIRDCIPEDRLMFYSPKDGWEPLCKRLGLPIPKVPFPHNNDRNGATRDRNMMATLGVVFWTVYIVGIGGPAWYLWRKYG